jgi:hypothetical protein
MVAVLERLKWGKVGSRYITAVRHLDLAPQLAVLRSFKAELQAPPDSIRPEFCSAAGGEKRNRRLDNALPESDI